MALTFKTTQIANDAITAQKIKLDGGDYHFTSGAELRWATDPTNADDLTRKSYVDNLVAGLKWRQSVRLATTANITLSGLQGIDGVTTVADDRVLVKNQSAGEENGVYLAKAGAWARTTDMDAGADFPSAAMFVREGSTYQDTAWSCTNDTNPTLGTTAIVFAQFSGGGSLTGGSGVTVSGNTISVNVDNTSIEVNGSDQLAIKAVAAAKITGTIANTQLANNTVAFGGVSLSLGGSDATPAFDLTDATNYPTSSLTGTITAAQLAGGIGNGKLSNSAISVTDGTTSTAVSLGGTITYTAGEGIDITQSGGEVTIVGETATSANMGVAKFNTASFDVTSGDVTIKTGGVTNTQLVNSTISGKSLGSSLSNLSMSSTTNGLAMSVDYNGSAAVTFGLDLNALATSATVNVAADSFAFVDADDNDTYKDTIADLISAVAGTGLTAGSGQLSLTASTISGRALGTNLLSLSATSGSGISLTAYNGSAAVSNLALDINGMTNEATLSSINDEIVLYDKSATANKKSTISALASAITGTNLTYDATNGTIKLDSNTISGRALGTNLNTLGAAVGGGITMTAYNGSAAVNDITLDVNGLSAPTSLAVSTDAIAIAATNDSNASKKVAIATLATAQAGTGISATNGQFSITAGAIGIAQLGLTPRLDTPTTDGSTKVFNLVNDLGSDSYAHPAWVIAYVNGQRMKGLTTGTATDDSEYTVSRAGTTSTVTFGANLAASDVLQIQYLT